MHAREGQQHQMDKSRQLQRGLGSTAKRRLTASTGLILWRACEVNAERALNATSGRSSESRMRANLTYGLRWQGMETRIWCG